VKKETFFVLYSSSTWIKDLIRSQ